MSSIHTFTLSLSHSLSLAHTKTIFTSIRLWKTVQISMRRPNFTRLYNHLKSMHIQTHIHSHRKREKERNQSTIYVLLHRHARISNVYDHRPRAHSYKHKYTVCIYISWFKLRAKSVEWKKKQQHATHSQSHRCERRAHLHRN